MSETVQVNTSLDPKDAVILDEMAQASGYDNRSAFVRWLIRQEYARRNQPTLPSPIPTETH